MSVRGTSPSLAGPEAPTLTGLPRFDPACGEPLRPDLRQRAEQAFRAGFSQVRVHASPSTRGLLLSVGAAALTLGERILVLPEFWQPDSPWGRELLFHELVHVVQQRGGTRWPTDVPPAIRRALESEAVGLAQRAARGENPGAAPFQGGPAVQANPLLFLLVLAGVALWPRRAHAPSSPVDRVPPHLYETGWGFVPVVGSLDQMINGENFLEQMTGAVFFVMDVSLVGGLARAGVRGLLFALRPSVRQGLAAAARTGGNTTQRAAWRELLSGGAGRLLTEAEAARLVSQLSRGGSHVIAGARTGSEGIHHSVLFVIHNGRIFKLHGGILRFAAGVTPRQASQVVTEQWLRGFNTVSVFGPDDLARLGLRDEALLGLVARWEGRSAGGVVQSLVNLCSALGCAASQAHLLAELGIFDARGASRYLPLLLERSRMAGTVGQHFVLNPGRALWGSTMHLGLGPTAGAGYAGLRFISGAGSAVPGYLVEELGSGLSPTSLLAEPFPQRNQVVVGPDLLDPLSPPILSPAPAPRGGEYDATARVCRMAGPVVGECR